MFEFPLNSAPYFDESNQKLVLEILASNITNIEPLPLPPVIDLENDTFAVVIDDNAAAKYTSYSPRMHALLFGEMTKYMKDDFKFELKVKDIGNPAGEKNKIYNILIKCGYCEKPVQ